ncbi:MAG: tRNA preQ1(34) S-adenosylmethionine ribosyltransferase-isomerase QueA [Deltaproteobacteria bacterium]|jgi:S-adenosylmethionine:tRNA ribosyltransferase-isomerase|nr:tRNA preQ1(34) S-adenosylmethionine ribosyltransferase-isomerase QueA [Deltaproteobacteria bacterium]
MDQDFNIESYQYDLPKGRIAQFPEELRDRSRLLVLDNRNNRIQDRKFTDILDFLKPGDLLIVNDTKVFPARLEGRKETGGRVEFFLLEYPAFDQPSTTEKTTSRRDGRIIFKTKVTGLLKSSKRPRKGARLLFNPKIEGELLEYNKEGKASVRLDFYPAEGESPEEILIQSGRVPLPPYIRRDREEHPSDRERYQTLFARKSGAVAAPTAGLHFSEELLRKIKEHHIRIAAITLHVGYGTFAPVRVRDIRQHKIHEEYVEVSTRTAEMINQTRLTGNKIWAVGTTTVRTLEFAAGPDGKVQAVNGWCGLYIYPGYNFKVVNALITNFHLPGSSLLFLVAALAGRSNILRAYNKAIEIGYRFYSYGDAMLIIT